MGRATASDLVFLEKVHLREGVQGLILMGSIEYLVVGWTNPFEKYAQVKLDHFPK